MNECHLPITKSKSPLECWKMKPRKPADQAGEAGAFIPAGSRAPAFYAVEP